MNAQQIESFLAAANSLSFTEAAERLHITQPAISKQIAALEKELNMQLFVREAKGLRLTPAGRVLQKELPDYKKHYDEIVARAQAAYKGYKGKLNIAILDGHITDHDLNNALNVFKEAFPNIDIDLFRRSFRMIREGLEDLSVDAAITLDFDIPASSGFETLFMRGSKAKVAIPVSNPLSQKIDLSLKDLENETFIVPEDTVGGFNLLVESCRECGFYPKVKHAKNLHAAMLEVESGLGVSMMNDANSLSLNPNASLRVLPELTETNVILVWNPKNANFIISDFVETVRASISEK